ncbi:MAG: hypothetical protein GMKNLPBB_03036 [Myxococcota bacterium]|nr:hypothetical protein [Myxococcota bacterium]
MGLGFTRAAIAACCLAALVPAGTLAKGRVFVNGRDVTGQVNLKYQLVNVEVDAAGDVRITTTETPSPKLAPALPKKDDGKLAKKYWLVTRRGSDPAGADIELWVNGKLARKIMAHDEQIVQEITGLVAKGNNKVLIRSTPAAGAGVAEDNEETSPEAWLEIYVGPGGNTEGKMVFEGVDVQFRRTGVQPAKMQKEFEFEGE